MEKFRAAVAGGLDERKAIKFFSDLSVDDYDRLMAVFGAGTVPELTADQQQTLVKILLELRRAKLTDNS